MVWYDVRSGVRVSGQAVSLVELKARSTNAIRNLITEILMFYVFERI